MNDPYVPKPPVPPVPRPTPSPAPPPRGPQPSGHVHVPLTSGNPQVPATQNVLTGQDIPQQGLAGSFDRVPKA